MPTDDRCQSCGKSVTADALMGLCPECLLKAGVATGSEAGGQVAGGKFVPPTPEELARFFPQLEILELLGRGGMGAVYKARQTQLDRFVAVKILPPGIGDDPAFAVRFAREAKALAKLNHPNIVTLYEFGQTDGLFYFIMEFVDGLNLRQLLHAGRIAPREALAIVPQICDALQYAHDAGIVHRDIKPENILLDRQGRVKVADFGLAKLTGQADALRAGTSSSFGIRHSTIGNPVMGTPQYMAPEQTEHPSEVDHRADIYSLGVVFYQMLTGELPAGKTFEPPSSRMRGIVVDVRLDEVVLRALEKEPERRYQQASILKTQVETILTTPLPADGAASPATPGTAGAPKVSPCVVSTPEYLKTFTGRFLYIYQGKGELRLDGGSLSFRSGWQEVTIPLSSIRSLARGEYPATAKPLPLHYIAVTFTEHGAPRTLLFTPVRSRWMAPWEANQIAAEWLSALQQSIRACTGRTLSIEQSDAVQSGFWGAMAKTFLLMAALSTLVFALMLPPILKQGLPNRLSALLWGPITAAATIAVLLALRWWRSRFAVSGGNLDALTSGAVGTADKPPGAPVTTTTGMLSHWRRFVGSMLGITFTKPAAIRWADASLQGFLGLLGFFGFLPGMQRWFGFFGLFGFFGMLGFAVASERGTQGKTNVLTEPRFSRTAIVGAVWSAFALVAPALRFLESGGVIMPAGSSLPTDGQWLWILVRMAPALGYTAFFGTTILGCVALAQIRRSAGRLYGLWLALFDALLFPLLALDGLIGAIWYALFAAMAKAATRAAASAGPYGGGPQAAVSTQTVFVLTLLVSAVVDFLLIRRAWRAANKPVGGNAQVPANGGRSSPQAQQPGASKSLRPALLTAAWHALLMLATLGFFVVVVPRFSAMFIDFAVAVPTLTRLTLTASRAITHGGFLLFPVLLALDAGICILTQVLAGRWLRHVWSALVVCGWGALVLVAGASLYLPMRSLTRVLSATDSKPPAQQIIVEFDWARMAAEHRLLGGVPVTVEGRAALRIENTNDAPLQLALFQVEGPAITGRQYALTGETKYEQVRGDGYLEMWNCFTPPQPGLPEAKYFTRTLGAPGTGPLAKITGTSGWRAFALPFDRSGVSDPPSRLEVNIFLPGRGVVFLGPLTLSQSAPPPASPDAAFGPVIERTISASDVDEHGLVFFDVETGQIVKTTVVPKFRPRTEMQFLEVTPELRDWIHRTDVDLVLRFVEQTPEVWAYMLLGMEKPPLRTNPDRIQPRDVAAAFAAKDADRRASKEVRGPWRSGSSDPEAEEACGSGRFWFCDPEAEKGRQRWDMFRTRKGAIGLISMVGVDPDKDSRTLGVVNIRYKLVQNVDDRSSTNKPRMTTDRVIVEDLTLRMLAAIRDKEDDMLKSLAVDRIKGWRDALPQFAFEMRERFRQMTGKPFDMQVTECIVEGDRAVVKCTGPNELQGVYLTLFFVKTDNGWRNWTLRNAPSTMPLKEHLEQKPPTSATASAGGSETPRVNVPLGFGPVIEREIPFGKACLKLETGELLPLSDLASAQDVRRTAGDLFFSPTQSNLDNLTVVDLWLLELEESAWTHLPAKALEEKFAQEDAVRRIGRGRSEQVVPPGVYGFKGYGKTGLLAVFGRTGPTSNTWSGVKIRYKLVARQDR